jgi:signal transduction histidine kinase
MAMLVHELKTPLSVIRMVLGGSGIETKLREAAGRAVRSMSDVIERCRQAEMVEDLNLHTSKFESVDLNRLAIELIDEREMARRTKLDTRFPVSVQSDPTLVKVVLSNLLDNANLYSPAGSSVTLRLAPEAQQGIKGVRLVVSNLANPGSLPDADRVFNKYYRHASAQRDTGSGLGLFLVRELSERLGGWVRYTPPSSDSPTLSFAVWLPVSLREQEGT